MFHAAIIDLFISFKKKEEENACKISCSCQSHSKFKRKNEKFPIGEVCNNKTWKDKNDNNQNTQKSKQMNAFTFDETIVKNKMRF